MVVCVFETLNKTTIARFPIQFCAKLSGKNLYLYVNSQFLINFYAGLIHFPAFGPYKILLNVILYILSLQMFCPNIL